MEKTKSQISREYGEAHGIPVIDIPLPSLKEFENQLPEWALRKSESGKIQRMQNLYTKHARMRGNATVADILYNTKYAEPLFIVATDAGSIIKCNYNELQEMFHIGEYIVRDFCNPLIVERLKEL